MARKEKKRINLGLQGGGAHGAFTWGVLDRLLEEENLDIDAVSGTSAGAMNAAVLADGMARNGRLGAKEHLANFWKRISEAGEHSFLQRMPWDRMMYGWNMDSSPPAAVFDMMTRMFSPYEMNPSDFHPLRDVLAEFVDFSNLNENPAMKLFINTTNVSTGKVRVFETGELTVEVLLASACLPFLFKAIEIDGEFYWDGGYMGNPAIFPLIYGSGAPDVVVVQINPFTRTKEPRTAREILDRVNEISFNSSLMREMRVISFVRKIVEDEGLDPDKYKRLNVHFISAEEEMRDLGVTSKLNAEWDFLLFLHDLGRKTADSWIEANYDSLNVRSTIDLARFV